MATDVLYMTEQIGNEFRGLVIDAKTYKTVFITAHNYCTETVAACAAKRAYAERVPEEVHALLAPM